MIVDAHVHVYPPEIIENCEKIAATEPYFAKLTAGTVHKWATADDLLAAMDKDGVDESWACGFGFRDLGLCRLCNDYLLEAAKRSGGRVKVLAVVPPLARGVEAELTRVAELGAIGAGEIFPDGQCWDITDSRETWRFAACCEELGLFALIHTAEQVGHDYPGKGTVGAKEAYELACHHPALRILFAHWGGGLPLYESVPEVASALQNVYYDTAAMPYVYGNGLYAAAEAAGVISKVLYGSDYPLLRYPRYLTHLDGILSDAAADALFSQNAGRLLSGQISG